MSPAMQANILRLLDNWPQSEIARLKTEKILEMVHYPQEFKDKVRTARASGLPAVEALEAEVLASGDFAAMVDLFLGYRAVKGYRQMLQLAEKMPSELSRTALIQEQLGFALNRLGRRAEAIATLEKVIEKHGPSSETNSLLGRVRKDLWEEAQEQGDAEEAYLQLQHAIETYLAGFEADRRDAYPGINAVTLMELSDPPDSRQQALLPAVRAAVDSRLREKTPDYFDYATLLELAVLASDQDQAEDALRDAMALPRDRWASETTARNLSLIRRAREVRGIDSAWIQEIEHTLTR